MVVFFITHAILGAVMIAGCFLSHRGLRGLESMKLASYAVGSGLFYFVGTLFLLLALAGFAGPASAIANTSSIGVLVLDAIVYSPPIKPLKILGTVIAIVGVSLLALAPQPPPKPQTQKGHKTPSKLDNLEDSSPKV